MNGTFGRKFVEIKLSSEFCLHIFFMILTPNIMSHRKFFLHQWKSSWYYFVIVILSSNHTKKIKKKVLKLAKLLSETWVQCILIHPVHIGCIFELAQHVLEGALVFNMLIGCILYFLLTYLCLFIAFELTWVVFRTQSNI